MRLETAPTGFGTAKLTLMVRLETAPTGFGTAKLTPMVRLETAPTVRKIGQIPLIWYQHI